MPELPLFGRWFIILGALLILVGILLISAGKVPLLGKLPGDIFIKRDNFTFYFPIATSIVLSIILTLLLNLFTRR